MANYPRCSFQGNVNQKEHSKLIFCYIKLSGSLSELRKYESMVRKKTTFKNMTPLKFSLLL